jgi:hypothetical protein
MLDDRYELGPAPGPGPGLAGYGPWTSRVGAGPSFAAETPQLFVLPNLRMRGRRLRHAVEPLQAPDSPCPSGAPIDRAAVPAFPLFGARRPFPWLSDSGENPEACARVGADGRVGAAFIAAGHSSDDIRLLRAISALNFVPAERAGRPAGAWHRLIVNRRRGFDPGAPIEPEFLFPEAPYSPGD